MGVLAGLGRARLLGGGASGDDEAPGPATAAGRQRRGRRHRRRPWRATARRRPASSARPSASCCGREHRGAQPLRRAAVRVRRQAQPPWRCRPGAERQRRVRVDGPVRPAAGAARAPARGRVRRRGPVVGRGRTAPTRARILRPRRAARRPSRAPTSARGSTRERDFGRAASSSRTGPTATTWRSPRGVRPEAGRLRRRLQGPPRAPRAPVDERLELQPQPDCHRHRAPARLRVGRRFQGPPVPAPGRRGGRQVRGCLSRRSRRIADVYGAFKSNKRTTSTSTGLVRGRSLRPAAHRAATATRCTRAAWLPSTRGPRSSPTASTSSS